MECKFFMKCNRWKSRYPSCVDCVQLRHHFCISCCFILNWFFLCVKVSLASVVLKFVFIACKIITFVSVVLYWTKKKLWVKAYLLLFFNLCVYNLWSWRTFFFRWPLNCLTRRPRHPDCREVVCHCISMGDRLFTADGMMWSMFCTHLKTYFWNQHGISIFWNCNRGIALTRNIFWNWNTEVLYSS